MAELAGATQDGANKSNKKPASKATTKSNDKKPKLQTRKVDMADFLRALDEVKPAFGMDNVALQNYCLGGILEYGDAFNQVFKACGDFIKEINNSSKT